MEAPHQCMLQVSSQNFRSLTKSCLWTPIDSVACLERHKTIDGESLNFNCVEGV